jgi:equilibrative nucleoside transporter 1/2/3
MQEQTTALLTVPQDEPESTVTVYLSEDGAKLRKSEAENENRPSASGGTSLSRIYEVFKVVSIPSFSVWLTFTVTIAIFPSLTVLIESTKKCESSERFFNDLFTPFMFLLFNIFDLVGRIAAGATKPIFNPKNIWIAAVARFIFWPLFLLCNVSNSQLSVLFKSDACAIIFMIFMAFTNGYVASNSMMMGAEVASAKDSGLAGTIMVFSLTVGLFCGSCFSFIIVYISQGSL